MRRTVGNIPPSTLTPSCHRRREDRSTDVSAEGETAVVDGKRAGERRACGGEDGRSASVVRDLGQLFIAENRGSSLCLIRV